MKNTLSIDSLPEVRHPYSDYTLKEAVNLAVSSAKNFGLPLPVNLNDVREWFREGVSRGSHVWITGLVALDLLDAAIDGKDIKQNSHIY